MLLLFVVVLLVVLLTTTSGLVPSNSQSHESKSKSKKSHSHKSKSHSHKSQSKSHESKSHHSESQSHSQSQSYGNCNNTLVTEYPTPQPPFGANSTFPLWPQKINIQLSGNGKGTNPSTAWVRIYYNYTYFHEKNPSKVKSCDLSPDLSKIPYINEVNNYVSPNFDSHGCNMVCVISFSMELNCPLVDVGGKYALKIPHIGSVELDISVCLNDGVDYGVPCQDVPPACSVTSPFLSAPTCKKEDHDGLSKADKVGISFGVVGFAMLVAIIVLIVLYLNLQVYVTRYKPLQ